MSPIEKQLRKELGLTATEDLLEFAHATQHYARAKNVNDAIATHNLILRDVYLHAGVKYGVNISLDALVVAVSSHLVCAQSKEARTLVERIKALAQFNADANTVNVLTSFLDSNKGCIK